MYQPIFSVMMAGNVKENFLAYTEQDAGGDLTVDSATQITVSTMDRNVDDNISFDWGVGYWSGVITAECAASVNTGSVTSGLVYILGFAETLGSFVDNNNAIAVYADYVSGTQTRYWVIERDGGTQYVSSSIAGRTLDVLDYPRLTRTITGGANGFGVATLDLYSDAARTTLVGSVPVDLHTSVKAHRYSYGVQGRNDGATPFAISATIQNLSISQE